MTDRNSALAERVKREADHTCAKCGYQTDRVHAHHIRPIAVGGSDEEWNLEVLCPNCHRYAPDALPAATDYELLFDRYVSTGARPEIDIFGFGIEYVRQNPGMLDHSLGEFLDLAAWLFGELHGLGGDVATEPSFYWLGVASVCGYVDRDATDLSGEQLTFTDFGLSDLECGDD